MRIGGLVVAMVCFFAGFALAAGNAAAGKGIYDKTCKTCHGAAGVANPAIAKMMKTDIKDLGSAEIQAKSDADFKKIITEGKDKMKPVKTVAGKDIDDVVAFVRTLKK